MFANTLGPGVGPTGLLAALRWLWQRSLFPGRVEADSRLRVASLVTLLVLPALFLYPWMHFHLLDPDEGRYAEIPREMLARGEWVVPYLQSEPYLDKPPLMYWLVMVSYSLLGVHDWAARLIPALAVHGTILITYWLGRFRLGERVAFRGALLLSLTPALMGMGRLLILDGLLTFWVTLASLSGWLAFGDRDDRHTISRQWLVCALSTGFGVLTKGPVAVVLVALPLVLFRWLNGWPRIRLRPWIVFGVVVATINVPWFLAMAIRRPEFGPYFFVQHNLQRFLAPFDHLEPIWYYAPILLGGLLPGTFLLWRLARDFLSNAPAAAERRTPELGFALLAGGWCIAFFSLSGSKLPTYILPAFPLLCLAVGTQSLGRRSLIGGAIWMALLLFANAWAIPWYAKQRSPMGAPAAELRAACSDPATVICCYPRSCDSAGFYLERDDLQATRSKFVHLLIADLLTRQRTVVLFTHRHSYDLLRESLPPELTIEHWATFGNQDRGAAWLTRLVGDSPWGLCDLAIIHNSRPKPSTVPLTD